ncbi:histidine kinase [Streptomyces sp. NPDC001941]|uniref:sensor histidine kinase n=1 Tax=Streptomyces sp. NPDC001941 TaxID=3154659 RepID=UPI003329CD66
MSTYLPGRPRPRPDAPHAEQPWIRQPWTTQRCAAVLAAAVGAVLLVAVDVLSVRPGRLWPVLVCEALVTAVAFAPLPRLRLPWRAAAAIGLSLGGTALLTTWDGGVTGSWGLLETAALLVLLGRTARRAPAGIAVGLSLLLAVSVMALPLRMRSTDGDTFAFLLTLAAAGAGGLGAYLRVLDDRRDRAVLAVRDAERRELARDLHDFVAHHVTGIVVQAQAAQAVRESAPDQLEPILRSIERAGTETLDSMRRLVRVLREESTQAVRQGELTAELAELVAAHGRDGRGADARLRVSSAARAARLAPEVGTSVQRVVQEGLTNIARHAAGAEQADVVLDTDHGALVVDVVNSAPPRRTTPPGGRGGLGLIGLRERTEAVNGSFAAGPEPGGGWRVTARFPTLAAPPPAADGELAGSGP